MQRRMVSGIMLTMLLIGTLTLAFNTQLVKATSLRVHNIDTNEDFATIQEAIDDWDTSDGHTILVDAGTYYELVTVHKSLTLIGENRETTIIDGQGIVAGRVFKINAEVTVTITGFTIRNAVIGIELVGSSGNVIKDNNITLNEWAGISGSLNSSTIIDNEITAHGHVGVYMVGQGNEIIGNVVNHASHGIWLDDSIHSFVSNNTVTYNKRGIVLMASEHNEIFNNTVTNNWRDGIYLFHSDNNTILGNNIWDNNNGITPEVASNNIIYHNNFIGNTFQIDNYKSINTWDDGYPSGGNYWSDYTSIDKKSGPNQDQPLSDGIGDTPYIIDGNNQDNFPLVRPFPGPLDPTRGLIKTIETWSLPKGIENSLTSKLHNVIHLLEIDNENGAIHKLMDFINQVEALREKKLNSVEADYLISKAQRIIEFIEG